MRTVCFSVMNEPAWLLPLTTSAQFISPRLITYSLIMFLLGILPSPTASIYLLPMLPFAWIVLSSLSSMVLFPKWWLVIFFSELSVTGSVSCWWVGSEDSDSTSIRSPSVLDRQAAVHSVNLISECVPLCPYMLPWYSVHACWGCSLYAAEIDGLRHYWFLAL